MIDASILERSIKPGTSKPLINHILFTNYHHYGHLSHDGVVAKFNGRVIGEFIDFEKLEQLRHEQAVALADAPRVVVREVTVDEALRSLYGDAFLNHLRRIRHDI